MHVHAVTRVHAVTPKLDGAIWPYRECLLSVVCFSLSLWEMVLLLIVGGAIPASW